ncbi:BREX-1 system phosphatase PglZ type A [Corynebacterium sp. SCR221107]|uniref:BREX-1 system phosphatase PglZ type A n=1 Tax=Corynebacterium sp. SCR221107 TaxID=3017361 RepID=UPI0022EC1AF9|nr:BREX-1 system phosphatase PglZ type A [Corynebacterium sp. SCR221107]WBT09187.1 BREX-1 system phosphatase PglZ type A [Corynebacterium sp. SCR221107]
MNNGVTQNLLERFDRQRVVFWHDEKGDYESELDSLVPEGVELIRVDNNEFGVKNTLLSDTEGKYVVYRSGTIPTGTGNWLLDLELAYGVFTADRNSLLMEELGLEGENIGEVIEQHAKFFAAKTRRKALKDKLDGKENAVRVRAKMCQVLVKADDCALSNIVRELLIDHANEEETKFNELASYGLKDYLWNGMAQIYHYRSENPSMEDFVLWMFERAFENFVSENTDEYLSIRRDFNHFLFDNRNSEWMRKLSDHAADMLGIGDKIESYELKELAGISMFKEVDRRLVSLLNEQIAARTISPKEVSELVRQRKTSLWHSHTSSTYQALEHAAYLLADIEAFEAESESVDDALTRYQQEWYRIDQRYRWFIQAVNPSSDLKKIVDLQYTNRYLHPLGTMWQQHLDTLTRWSTETLPAQSEFFEHYVKARGTKVVVIISDAMRYEIGEELASRIRREDRYDATTSAMLSSLPSYTQLGMAALLPHSTLELPETGKPVYADGASTEGTANRGKILSAFDGCALRASEIVGKTGSEMRALYRQHQIFYIYHDQIDATGDDAGTESGVFKAAETALEELVSLVKKWFNANASCVLVTADHGFLYQDTKLEESFYLSEKPEGEQVTKINRRYVFGRALTASPAFMTFQPQQLGLEGDIEVQIPKSIHRIKLSGAGTRYVHGGASLQEVVVPVVAVTKKSKSDVRMVEVAYLPESDKITTGQLAVKLYQGEPVSDKIQPCTVRVGLYGGGKLISDQPVAIFESTSEDHRERYQTVVVMLTQDADDFNNRAVELRVKAKIPGTERWKEIAKGTYTIRRAFTSDFDLF